MRKSEEKTDLSFLGSKGFQLFSLVGYLEFSITVINSMYFLFVAFFQRNQQMSFIEKVQKIDESLRYNFKTNIDYSRYKISSTLALICVVVYYNIIVSCVMLFFLIDIQSASAIATFVVYTTLSCTSGIFAYGYVSYVILIHIRFIKVNEKLEEIVRFSPEALEKMYKTKDALCKEMMRYTKIYKNLCSCVDDLNQIYGSSMVLLFAHDFTLLTTQIFSMFYISFYNPDESLPKILALIVWLLPNIIKMSFICFECHMTRNEVKTCSIIFVFTTSITFIFRSKLALCTWESSVMKPTKTNLPISLTCFRFNQFTSKPNSPQTISSPSTCRFFSQSFQLARHIWWF